jgi:hypothetical protein
MKLMKILVICKFYTERIGLHIAETLALMRHAVRRFEPGIRSERLGGKLGHRIDQFSEALHTNSDGIPVIRALRMRSHPLLLSTKVMGLLVTRSNDRIVLPVGPLAYEIQFAWGDAR